MEHDPRTLLFDIAQSCRNIREFTRGLDLEGYTDSTLVKSAVERQFTIIGKALNRLRQVDGSIYNQIPQAGKIIGFRNILVHGYEVVSDQLVWDIVKNHLDALAKICEEQIAIN